MAQNYVCPHCGAYDSSRCDALPEDDPEKAHPFTQRQMRIARAVGCRVVHYIDQEKQKKETV